MPLRRFERRSGPQLLEQPTGEAVKSDSDNSKEFELTRNSERKNAERGLERPRFYKIAETPRAIGVYAEVADLPLMRHRRTQKQGEQNEY